MNKYFVGIYSSEIIRCLSNKSTCKMGHTLYKNILRLDSLVIVGHGYTSTTECITGQSWLVDDSNL